MVKSIDRKQQLSKRRVPSHPGVVLLELPEEARQSKCQHWNYQTPRESYWSNSPRGAHQPKRSDWNCRTPRGSHWSNSKCRTPRGGAQSKTSKLELANSPGVVLTVKTATMIIIKLGASEELDHWRSSRAKLARTEVNQAPFELDLTNFFND